VFGDEVPLFSLSAFTEEQAFRIHVASLAYHSLRDSHRSKLVSWRGQGRFEEVRCLVREIVYASFVHAKPSLVLLAASF